MRMTIDVTYRVVTPLFCAGVDRKKGPELRLPSFKGVLRYWWRALAWSRYDGDLAVLRQREDRLFGSADAGQSRILLRLIPATRPETVARGDVLTVSASSSPPVGDGARYLGYGLMEAFASSRKETRAGQLQRACLRSPVDSPFDFTVQMRVRGLGDRELGSLTNALIALGTLGGMGARSRRGYGSLALQSLRVDDQETWHAPTSADELGESIATLRHGGGSGLPVFTAVSNEARHVLVSGDTEQPVELLDLVGRELVRFRSWGHKRTVFGKPSEQKFKDDHDLMKKDSRQRKTHPAASPSACLTTMGGAKTSRSARGTRTSIGVRVRCSSISTSAEGSLLPYSRFFPLVSCRTGGPTSRSGAAGFHRSGRPSCTVPFTSFSTGCSIRGNGRSGSPT